jgi:hypothetical protein
VAAVGDVYADAGGGDWRPQTNYAAENQFQYATTNWINTNEFGRFFNPYTYRGDANLVASLNTAAAVPEPALVGVIGVAGAGAPAPAVDSQLSGRGSLRLASRHRWLILRAQFPSPGRCRRSRRPGLMQRAAEKP